MDIIENDYIICVSFLRYFMNLFQHLELIRQNTRLLKNIYNHL